MQIFSLLFLYYFMANPVIDLFQLFEYREIPEFPNNAGFNQTNYIKAHMGKTFQAGYFPFWRH